MNITQLKKTLEPWIRSIVRDELKKGQKVSKSVYSDGQMDQILKNASRAMGFLKDLKNGFEEPKDNEMNVEWVDEKE